MSLELLLLSSSEDSDDAEPDGSSMVADSPSDPEELDAVPSKVAEPDWLPEALFEGAGREEAALARRGGPMRIRSSEEESEPATRGELQIE